MVDEVIIQTNKVMAETIELIGNAMRSDNLTEKKEKVGLALTNVGKLKHLIEGVEVK